MNEGLVKRSDLHLRAAYPEINTAIYKLNEEQFIIHCTNVNEDFQIVENEFANSIKPITLPVRVALDPPSEFIEIISSIPDNEIAKNFEGVSFTRDGLLNLLMSKFPNIHFSDIELAANGINIYTESFKEIDGDITHFRFLNDSDRDKLHRFLDCLGYLDNFSIIELKVEKPSSSKLLTSLNPIQNIYSTRFRKDYVSEFSLRDEALWFDSLDNIFEGKTKKDDLYFYDSREYSCYVDFSSFENIDLRNHLFLFQTIYMTPPYDQNIIEWLKKSKIQKNEFLELVKRKRIKLLLTQPEFRYDISFIREVYEVDNNAVVSRRALATLQQIDIADISNNYLFNDDLVLKDLRMYCQAIGEVTNKNPKYVYDFLVWPIRVRRNSFEQLHSSGLFSVPSFGVNTAIEKGISDAFQKDLSFDFTVNSTSIHLANSLNAKYFPYKTESGYSDSYYANIMGEMLNFYKSANSKNIKSFLDSRNEIDSGVLPINPIDVIDVNDYISITEFEQTLSKDVIYPNSKRLIETLSNLSEADRKSKISEYNSIVNKKLNKRNKSESIIDLGQNIIMDTAGYISGSAIIGTAFSLAKTGGKKLTKSIPLIRNVTSKIEEAFNNDTDRANVHYLTKINRVASVKRNL